MKQKTTKALASLLEQPMFNVEVTSNTSSAFPFHLFTKKSFDDSGNYPNDPKNPNHSYADFGFNRKMNAMRFAIRAREHGLEARVFKFHCHVEVEYKMIDSVASG